jgi:hypothetical protein
MVVPIFEEIIRLFEGGGRLGVALFRSSERHMVHHV